MKAQYKIKQTLDQTYISKLTDDELMALRCNVDAELIARDITFNVGSIGEKLCIAYFNSTSGLTNLLQAPTGSKNVDALSRNGERYSIKTFMKRWAYKAPLVISMFSNIFSGYTFKCFNVSI